MRTAVIALLSFLAIAASPADDVVVDKPSIEFLQSLRRPDGGYAARAAGGKAAEGSDLRSTTAAIRALKYLGGRRRDPGDTTRFVEKLYDKRAGGFAGVPGARPNVVSTAVGAMAAVELDVSPQLYREGVVHYLGENASSPEDVRLAAAAFEAMAVRPPIAAEWLRQVDAASNPDGTFGSGPEVARATGGATALILRLGGAIKNRHAVLKAMCEGQRADGGFGSGTRDRSDLESTYRVMRAFWMMNERPRAPDKLREFVGKCRYSSGGFGVVPGESPSAAGTYYAAAVLHWLGGH